MSWQGQALRFDWSNQIFEKDQEQVMRKFFSSY